MVAKSGRPLLHYAPILYRMALTGFLKLKWEDRPEPTRQEEMDTYQSRKFDVAHFQGEMEAALATALYSQEEYTAIREARAVRLRPVLTRYRGVLCFHPYARSAPPYAGNRRFNRNTATMPVAQR